MTDDLTLTIAADGLGMPARVAGFLMSAIAAAYPGTTVHSSTGGQLRLTVPAEDYRSEAGQDRQRLVLDALRALDPAP